MGKEEVHSRRSEELEALRAYYGNDLSSTLAPSPADTENEISRDGPWFLRIRNRSDDNESKESNSSSLGTPTLEIRLSASYPLGDEPPTPMLHNIMMNPQLKQDFLQELTDMYDGFEVGILWGERCREELFSSDFTNDSGEKNENNDTALSDNDNVDDSQDDASVRTFIPSTKKFSQPMRHFPTTVIEDQSYRRDIVRTPPFHPPKSGPSEIMIAHVCSVHCKEHVQWALAELLFNDKKVARASHNMFAYRYTIDGILVSDNDDDGEKGSGAKLASLLQLSRVENVLVVVSRWFGGIHLGPARFKHIASVARDGLVLGGFLKDCSER
ncbi:hypothetical protein HJC23_001478 [Cyclotella cryptica]|uniref:RWD domain-containing protein n=1 Tax=Cyclotella cryptica TaxID=29204 RepID=A0ABD3NWS5_9STRA|eukprot:CCRYP_019403-RA/>CCRYP_019403-RA protein AED:0.45 eAED:0.44 QI:0/-1/0/1/-1/1/1/0/326